MKQVVLDNAQKGKAPDALQLQLAIHTLERAKLETALYSEALDKEVEFFHAHHKHSARGGESQPESLSTNRISLS